MVRKAALAFLLAPYLLCPATAAKADTVLSTGNSFLNGCEHLDNNAPFFYGVCAGFLEGLQFRDGLDSHNQWICRPKEVTNQQVMDVVIAYLKEHPETRHHSAGELAIIAMGLAFPCPAAKSG